MSLGPPAARARATGTLVLVAALVGLARPLPAAAPAVPPLVFAARRPMPGDGIPGLGPAGRTQVTSGKLMLRGAAGDVRELLPPGTCADVAHPSVSWDGRRIVFAATVAPDSGWRIWLADADGTHAHPITRTPADGALVDDLDPCWLADGRIVLASTPYPQRDEAIGRPVTQLFVCEADGRGLRRITTERNGAERPSLDPRDGRVVYARWWRSRYLATDLPAGITQDPAQALAAGRVDLWQALSVLPDGDAPRLAGGHPRRRAEQQAYAPVVLVDGTLVGVSADRPSMTGDPGGTSVVAYAHGFGARRALAGSEMRAGERAVAPAALPDGRIVCSATIAGTTDLGLRVMGADGRGARALLHLPGWMALDAAPLMARRPPPVPDARLAQPPRDRPPGTLAELLADPRTFRFDCMNVFASGPLDDSLPAAPPLTRGARIRFFAALSRAADAGGDTVVLVREAPLTAYGAVHVEDLPADVPMFEQVVGPDGRPLTGEGGPAQTASFNFARSGSGTRCIGCHVGHSALRVPRNGTSAAFVDAAPSAHLTAAPPLMGMPDVARLVDRRRLAPDSATGWPDGSAPWVRLEWSFPIDLREAVLYDPPRDPAARTDARLLEAHLDLLLGGRVVGTLDVGGAPGDGAHRATCPPTRVDAIVVRDLRGRGTLRGRPAVALAEIEAIARMAAP